LLSVPASGRKNVRKMGALQARYLLVVGLAIVLGLSVAVPVFAAGGGITPQVVGGEPAANGDFPFVASLGDVRYGGTAYKRHYCGASLIDRDSVLTAAHCVKGTPKWPLRVVVGRTALSGGGGQTRRVSMKVIHPRFNGTSDEKYDAAVLTLNAPVQGIPALSPAGAAQDGLEKPGSLATVAGWGDTIKQPPEGGDRINFPDRMHVARVPIVSDARARDVYGPSFAGTLMVAAGKEGKDTCTGDSGGPMFATQDGKRYQIGITSYGNGCATKKYPGVYTEVNARPIRTFIANAAGQ
jgi:secreted trypsin-like serine protease